MIVKALVKLSFGVTRLGIRFVVVPILISAATAVAIEKMQERMASNHATPVITPSV